MNSEERSRRLILAILTVALVIWAALLALGAYLGWGADPPRHDVRKPLIVLGSMAAFLTFWGIALWQRMRRQSRNPPSDSNRSR